MKKQLSVVLVILLALFAVVPVTAGKRSKRKADEQTQAWRYELEAVQTGVQGTYLIKVWSFSKKPAVAAEQSKKNAVHGVIFKGFAGKQGVTGQKALVTDPTIEQTKEQFFKEFFATGGDYMRYVNNSSDGSIGAGDRFKVGKEYKIGVVLSVNVAQLRKYLESKGVVKALNSMF